MGPDYMSLLRRAHEDMNGRREEITRENNDLSRRNNDLVGVTDEQGTHTNFVTQELGQRSNGGLGLDVPFALMRDQGDIGRDLDNNMG